MLKRAFSLLSPVSARLPRLLPSSLLKLGARNGTQKYSSLARRSNLMAQFNRIKEQYRDYILLFQVGDFYEMYGEDASKQSALEGQSNSMASILK